MTSAPPLPKTRASGGRNAALATLRPPRKAKAVPPSAEIDVGLLAHPVGLLALVIRTALGLKTDALLHPNEYHLVDGALRCLSGEYSLEAIPRLIEQVLDIAFADHGKAQAEGRVSRERPTLRYIFGGPQDAPHQPHRFFLDRIVEIRQRKIEAGRQQMSRDHARFSAMLFAGLEHGTGIPTTPSPRADEATPAMSESLLTRERRREQLLTRHQRRDPDEAQTSSGPRDSGWRLTFEEAERARDALRTG